VCDKRPTANPIAIHTPSGVILHSTHEANLDLPGLPAAARHGHIVPQLATQPLLSIGQLCDAGCHVAFTSSTVTISHDNAIILEGTRTPTSKLWELDIRPPMPHQANTALGSANVADLVAFTHAALFSPAMSTLEEALRRGHVPDFAGLSLQTLQKHPPLSNATIKGHLDQTRQNLRSTKTTPPFDPTPEPPDIDAFPPAI